MNRKNRVGVFLEELANSAKKGIAWLIDPDDISTKEDLENAAEAAIRAKVDLLFVGGSLLQRNQVDQILSHLASLCPEIPTVLFPGNTIQFSPKADALLFLSLISGRNPELLIGQHVQIAPLLEKSDIEILPTGYMLVDGGEKTSVHYISQTIPLPNHHPDLTVATALAGKFLGLKYFYLDAGSGAPQPVSMELIKAFKKRIAEPLIVGGGLNSLEKIKNAFFAGADLVVVGNGIGKNPELLAEAKAFVESLRVMAN